MSRNSLEQSDFEQPWEQCSPLERLLAHEMLENSTTLFNYLKEPQLWLSD